MMNIKVINFLGNTFLVLMFVVGVLHIHWASMFVGALLLSIIRTLYLKAEQNQTADNQQTTEQIAQNLPKAPNTMPSVRLFATYITALLMVAVIYLIGYGIGALLGVDVQLF